jgi:formylglycine-generating enzyme required for sulfatase activity
MADNVWEWTSSEPRAYPYDAADGREQIGAAGNRVLRGGAWDNNPRGARIAFRSNGKITNLLNCVGGRLVSDEQTNG